MQVDYLEAGQITCTIEWYFVPDIMFLNIRLHGAYIFTFPDKVRFWDAIQLKYADILRTPNKVHNIIHFYKYVKLFVYFL